MKRRFQRYTYINEIYRPVARIFRSGVTWVSDVHVCMHAQACKTRWIWGHAPTGKIRCLKLPFLDRSRPALATWLIGYCIQFWFWLSIYAIAKRQLTSNFHDRKYCGSKNSRWGDGWWNSMQRILKKIKKKCQKSIKLIRQRYIERLHMTSRGCGLP